jgi:CDP-diacylglycerol--glycerol-3-phosphate 3-phosphatidyltransferase
MANIITVARFPLLVLIVILLTIPSAAVRTAAVPLVLLLILLDTVDGIVARARKEESRLGSVLDIMADRSVEMVLWVVYAHLDLVPLAIPVIFIIRGTVVDSLRAVGVSEGKTPFGSTTHPIGRFLVGSSVMRTSYGVTKTLAFTLLALTSSLMAYAALGQVPNQLAENCHALALVLAWIATVFCIVRGVPVIVESFARLSKSAGVRPGV